MDTPKETVSSVSSTFPVLGKRIKKARKALGMTQEVLAAPHFSKAYVSAIERGAVRPSLKALEFLAQRLGVSSSELLGSELETESGTDRSLSALDEDLTYQVNYAKLLIRSNRVDEGLRLLDQARRSVQPHFERLSPRAQSLIPLTRAHAYLQASKPLLAREELQEALKLARDDEEVVAQAHNLMGVAFYVQEQPRVALEHHLRCLDYARSKAKDPNLRASIYRNLANDLWAINDPAQAISFYKEALSVLEDLNDLPRQAGIFWGMSQAYREQGDWSHAKLYGTRALHIYEAADNRSEAAAICLNLAEILIDEQRDEEAEQLVDRAKWLLTESNHWGLLSFLSRYYAELARGQGRLEEASRYIAESIALAERIRESSEDGANQPWVDPIRTYAEALQTAAQIEEALGHPDVADELFQRALAEIEQTSLDESIAAISFSYAETLQARGVHDQAAQYYRLAARPRGRRAH